MNNVNNNSMNQMVNMQATAAIAKELLESGSSPTAKALSKNQTSVTQSTTQVCILYFRYFNFEVSVSINFFNEFVCACTCVRGRRSTSTNLNLLLFFQHMDNRDYPDFAFFSSLL